MVPAAACREADLSCGSLDEPRFMHLRRFFALQPQCSAGSKRSHSFSVPSAFPCECGGLDRAEVQVPHFSLFFVHKQKVFFYFFLGLWALSQFFFFFPSRTLGT
jgi:hypothetical protein